MKIKKLTENEILEATPMEELDEIKKIFEEEKVRMMNRNTKIDLEFENNTDSYDINEKVTEEIQEALLEFEDANAECKALRIQIQITEVGDDD